MVIHVKCNGTTYYWYLVKVVFLSGAMSPAYYIGFQSMHCCISIGCWLKSSCFLCDMCQRWVRFWMWTFHLSEIHNIARGYVWLNMTITTCTYICWMQFAILDLMLLCYIVHLFLHLCYVTINNNLMCSIVPGKLYN